MRGDVGPPVFRGTPRGDAAASPPGDALPGLVGPTPAGTRLHTAAAGLPFSHGFILPPPRGGELLLPYGRRAPRAPPKSVLLAAPQRSRQAAHVPPVPSIGHCKREQYSSITGRNFGGYPARCVRYASVGSLPPFYIRLGTTLGKQPGSFGSRLEPHNATNIAWNVLGTFQPRVHRTLGRNFGGMSGT